jgi:hypothetical protein
MSKKLIGLLTSLCLLLPTSVFAKASNFDILLLPSLAEIALDGWYKIPTNSGPVISNTDNIVQGQAFSLFVVFSGYAIDKNNKIDITYDVQITDPQGKPTEDKGQGIVGYQGQAGKPEVLLLNQQIMQVVFTDEYAYGTYDIQVIAYDNISAKTVTSTIPIQLLPFNFDFTFSSDEEVNHWMMNYYREFTPQKTVAALQTVVQTDPNWIANHLNLLSFYSRIFADNPYLLNNISKHFDTFSLNDQKRFLLIDYLVGDNQLAVYTQQTTFSAFNQMLQTIHFPTLGDEITSPIQLDMLWSEFLATGKYAPIKKIVGALALEKYKGTLDKIKQENLDLTDQLRREAYLDATYQSAVWSLLSNNKQKPLVNKYCHFIYQNEELAENVKQQLAFILRRVQLDHADAQQK